MLDLNILNESVKQNFLGEDVINAMSYLCSWRKVDAVKNLACKDCVVARPAEVLHG